MSKQNSKQQQSNKNIAVAAAAHPTPGSAPSLHKSSPGLGVRQPSDPTTGLPSAPLTRSQMAVGKGGGVGAGSPAMMEVEEQEQEGLLGKRSRIRSGGQESDGLGTSSPGSAGISSLPMGNLVKEGLLGKIYFIVITLALLLLGDALTPALNPFVAAHRVLPHRRDSLVSKRRGGGVRGTPSSFTLATLISLGPFQGDRPLPLTTAGGSVAGARSVWFRGLSDSPNLGASAPAFLIPTFSGLRMLKHHVKLYLSYMHVLSVGGGVGGGVGGPLLSHPSLLSEWGGGREEGRPVHRLLLSVRDGVGRTVLSLGTVHSSCPFPLTVDGLGAVARSKEMHGGIGDKAVGAWAPVSNTPTWSGTWLHGQHSMLWSHRILILSVWSGGAGGPPISHSSLLSEWGGAKVEGRSAHVFLLSGGGGVGDYSRSTSEMSSSQGGRRESSGRGRGGDSPVVLNRKCKLICGSNHSHQPLVERSVEGGSTGAALDAIRIFFCVPFIFINALINCYES